MKPETVSVIVLLKSGEIGSAWPPQFMHSGALDSPEPVSSFLKDWK
jgi:hypothetical protein